MDDLMFNKRVMAAYVLVAMSLAKVPGSEGSTILVPDDQPTIQAGIDVASPGDSVVVRCGTYQEHSVVMRPSVTLRSETGDADCVTIDAKQRGRVIDCPEGIGLDTRIEGLTLTGGLALAGAGLICDSASPSVVNCAFINNQAEIVTAGAGGADLFDSNAIFINCVFADNIGPAIVGSACPALNIVNCTFYRNLSHQNDGSALLLSNATVTVSNCILAFSQRGSAIACPGPPSTVNLECCNIYGNLNGDWVGCIADQEDENGNFSLDPLLCDAEGGNLNLCNNSPCATEAWSCSVIGALPIGCGECGAQALEPSTWGQIKYQVRSLASPPRRTRPLFSQKAASGT